MDKDFHCKCWYDEVIEFVRVVVVSVITRSRVRSLLVVSDVDVIRNSYRSSAQGIPGFTVILSIQILSIFTSRSTVYCNQIRANLESHYCTLNLILH